MSVDARTEDIVARRSRGHWAGVTMPSVACTCLTAMTPLAAGQSKKSWGGHGELKNLHVKGTTKMRRCPLFRRLRASCFQKSVSSPMAERSFENRMPDYDPHRQGNEDSRGGGGGGGGEAAPNSLLVLLHEPSSTLSEKFLKAALSLKEEVLQATWISSQKHVRDPTLYTGVLGSAFLCFRSYQTTGDTNDLELCIEIVEKCAGAARSSRQCPTFICGQSGIYALGAVAAKCKGDHQRSDFYLRLFNEVGNQRALTAGPTEASEMPYELLYGRAGFLWAVLFLNNQFGFEVVPKSSMAPILDAVVAAGKKGASRTSCPLMYQWHGTRYWGAAHGLAGIIYCLLHFPLREDDIEAVKGTLRYMIRNRFPDSGNYPSSQESTNDRLVQWCHGAPGVALTLCKAAEVFPQESGFQKAALEAGEVVWHRGLLRKVGICHGISGNAYTFLALYRLLGHTHQLHRAKAFACFLLDRARDLIASGEMHGGDRPYSLFEGLAGTACLWLDMVNPKASKFPGYEI